MNRTIWILVCTCTLIFLLAGNSLFPSWVPATGETTIEEMPKFVALTFDDGPLRSTTEKLLDGLRKRGTKATFFLIGEQIEDNQDLITQMAADGHQIGLHTWNHKRLIGLNDRDFYAQVGRQAQVLQELLSKQEFALRPPYGTMDAGVERMAQSPLILWSVDPEDWKYKDAGRVADHVVSQVQDGDIILLHDIYPTSVEAAFRIVDTLHQQGFLFVTVDELAKLRHSLLRPGQVYRSFPP